MNGTARSGRSVGAGEEEGDAGCRERSEREKDAVAELDATGDAAFGSQEKRNRGERMRRCALAPDEVDDERKKCGRDPREEGGIAEL